VAQQSSGSSPDERGRFERPAQRLRRRDPGVPVGQLPARQGRRARRSPRDAPPPAGPADVRRDRGAVVACPHGRHDDVCCDVVRPLAPGPGQILIRVRACGVNRVHHALITGAVPQLFPHGAPYVRGMDAAGTVVATGDGVTRFAVGDEVFGHFPAQSWPFAHAPCVRTSAEGPHVERRPDGLDPVAAAALAEGGLTAKSILRAAELRAGQTALVIGATFGSGMVLLPLLAESGARVVATAAPADGEYVRSLGAAETIDDTTPDPVGDALARHAGVDLVVDLVTFVDPYLITAPARCGAFVTAIPGPVAETRAPGIPRIRLSAQPGDLAELAQRALDGRQPVEIAHVYQLEEICEALLGAGEPALALAS